MTYYNEFDPKAAAWLQQLIDDKQIPYGYVDSRSILEVHPSDLSGFTQCHFFAGVGGWSLALRLAGWPDTEPVWTASLPCQPFSTAGKQLGTDDERHLAPVFLELVRQCNPPVLFGEQVTSKIARHQWLPGIRLEFEALGYSFGAVDLSSPCAGEIGEGRIVRGDQESWERVIIGKPHIRQRLYWMAYANRSNEFGVCGSSGKGVLEGDERRGRHVEADGDVSRCTDDGLAHADSQRRAGINPLLRTQEAGADGAGHLSEATGCGEVGGDDGLPHSSSSTRLEGRGQSGEQPLSSGWEGAQRYTAEGSQHVLLPCRDGKTRRTQSGIFPLVNGIPRGVVPSGDPGAPEYANATAEARAARLKGYGNAIQIDTAVLFIKSSMEAINA